MFIPFPSRSAPLALSRVGEPEYVFRGCCVHFVQNRALTESRPDLKFVRTPAHEAAPQSSSHRQVPAGGHAPKQRVPNANRDQRSEDSVPQGEVSWWSRFVFVVGYP